MDLFNSAGDRFGLESRQQIHDQAITAIGNNSASNDHNQHKHDMNSQNLQKAKAIQNSELIHAAEHFAAGRTLGLEDTVTLELIRRKAMGVQNRPPF